MIFKHKPMNRILQALSTLTLIVFLAFNGQAFAQRRFEQQQVKEKIETARIAVFSNQMDLTPEEASVFWPQYNAYRKQMKDHKDQTKKVLAMLNKEVAEMSDEELNMLIDARLGEAKALMQTRTDFIMSLRKVLPPRKVIRFYKAEEQFKRMLLEKAAEKRMNEPFETDE